MKNHLSRQLRVAISGSRESRARVGIELRDATEDEKKAGFIGALVGEIPFNSDSAQLRDRSLNRGKPFVEQIAPDAFKRSITEDKDIMGFAGHTSDPLAAFSKLGENMTIETSATGMTYRALVPDTTVGRDLMTNVRHKIITGTSFEFNVNTDGEKWEKRGETDVRTITSARLFTVNPVAFPAYPDSELTAERSKRAYMQYQAFDYAYGDYRMTDDTSYALAALGAEVCELSTSLDYLRALPDGAFAEYAKEAAADAATDVTMLVTWLAANGATVDPDILARAKEFLPEKRETKPASTKDFTATDDARLRRLRVLQLDQS